MPETVLDLNLNRLTVALGDRALVREMRMQYSAGELLRVHVRKDNLPHEFAEGFQMRFMAKADGDLSGEAIIDATAFALDGMSYLATVNTMSEAVATALGVNGENEVDSIAIIGQFSWRADSEDPWHDCQVMTLHLDNTLRRGDEENVVIENLRLRKENGALVVVDGEETDHILLTEGEPEEP
jgi:hypothetical protein